jgi:hypothetical protein
LAGSVLKTGTLGPFAIFPQARIFTFEPGMQMKRILFASVMAWPLLFTACDSGTGDEANAKPVAFGTYRTFFSQKWYADDTSVRSFMDVETLDEDQTSTGRIYLIKGPDTALMCTGSAEWKQKGAALQFWNTIQQCKDPDDLGGGFVDDMGGPDLVSRPIRNVTESSFEMRGESIDGKVFWAKFSLF